MVTLDDVAGLLQKPEDVKTESVERTPSQYHPLNTFTLEHNRSYKQQYADIYYLRLVKIKPAVEAIASETWDGTVIGGEAVKKVDRVLDVRQGELCWVTGTVYMEMPLKPSILEDVSKDRWLSAPISTQKYYSDDGVDEIMLEDESGRIKLVGGLLKTVHLVTGCIVAIMGTENANGELEVIDIKFPDLAPQPQRWSLTKPTSNGKGVDGDEEMSDGPSSQSKGGKIAVVSGLSFSGNDPSYAVELDLLLEYLLGEAVNDESRHDVSRISRLIVAGNSISTAEAAKPAESTDKKPAVKKYGYDASTYNPRPSQLFDEFLAEVLPSMPVTLLPGAEDPANASYPQQAIHAAMFPRARQWGPDPAAAASKSGTSAWFDSTTNPWEAEVDGWRLLGTGGQNVDDVFKYVDSDDRLGMMEAMCRWRISAPTAPDTLWTYPFQDDEPFVMKDTPHLYFVGCQPEFSTKVIEGPEGQSVRLVTVPSFSVTKEVVLIDTETLDVSIVKISTT
ncbi:DNA polymerase subunit delta-2 [Plectosphaerella plurivora]|uniref:DNA-directed DNA polymerase n=1 Tax=Plectosphaerella plurivora TaxID=936078 RepID=A0A9P8VE24_9PEZI|nr:DNA polymerase subunit delta-2 [Plectosphaerella plurivora]